MLIILLSMITVKFLLEDLSTFVAVQVIIDAVLSL